jgi:anti-sigma regulatory factor (Ser/Thr protein kinase)
VQLSLQNSTKEAIHEMISQRGIKLCTRELRLLLSEMLNNLYIHATSKDEIRKEAK